MSSSSTVRMRTRVILVVHSHHSETPIELSEDLVSFKSSKSIKGVGALSVDVVPRKNYFNLIYPNDTVNLYVDPGDGKRGFIRLFMGYVDKVERTEATNEHGAVSSMFRIVCSDFQKAFEKTTIQVNPNIQHRQDLVVKEYLVSGAPTGLSTSGVRGHGSPADMVENLSSMLLGFGKQWVLPESYDHTSKIVADNRQRRIARAKDRIPVGALEGFNRLLDHTRNTLEDFSSFSEAEAVVNRNNVPPGKNPDEVESITRVVGSSTITGTSDVRGTTIKGTTPPEVFARIRAGIAELREYHVLKTDLKNDVYTVLDLIDLSFIETSTVDGYIQGAPIWHEGGSLISIMKKFSNEMMNELVFDLRPVAVPRKETSLNSDPYLDRCFGSEYSTDEDELGFNRGTGGDFASSTHAVAYVPAIVFREYPWSTVEGVDLGPLAADGDPLGFVPFGPIFSKVVGSGDGQYRSVYDYSTVKEVRDGTISIGTIGCNFDGPPLKHLDVVSIKNTDVINSTVGRSDNDLTNFYTMFSESPLGTNYKHIMKEFMPVTTPISIARNGLRAKEWTTRFADYGRDAVCDSDKGGTPQGKILKNIVRWLLLHDHWGQHKIEYLTGEVTLRGMPEIRVGYRLDWVDRKESYYVESVSHSWEYLKEMTTNLQVSRGQRNDPYLSYVPPGSTALTTGGSVRIEGGDRGPEGRLADFFEVSNTEATYNSTQVEYLSDSIIPSESARTNFSDAESAKVAKQYFGNIVYVDGIRDSAEEISAFAAFIPDAVSGSDPLVFGKPEKSPLPTSNVDTAATKAANSSLAMFKPARRSFDVDFEEWGPYWSNTRGNGREKLPVAFLRALAKSESSLNPSESNGPAWGLMQVGIDGFEDSEYAPIRSKAPKGTSGKVLKCWNRRFPALATLPPGIVGPDNANLNVQIATELLARITKVLKDEGLGGGAFNWESADHVGLLVAGWNGGYSKEAGVGRMIKWLTDNGIDHTLDNVYNFADRARVEIGEFKFKKPYSQLTKKQKKNSLSFFLSNSTKHTWWKKVVRRYFAEKARG